MTMEKGWFHPSRGYWQTTGDVPENLLEGYPAGTIEVPLKPSGRHEFDEEASTWFDPGEDPAVRLEVAKAECRRRIYAVASREAQTNIGTAASLVSAKTASSRNAEEKALLVAIASFSEWTAAMRTAAKTIADDDTSDLRSDSVWPQCPDAARDLIVSF